MRNFVLSINFTVLFLIIICSCEKENPISPTQPTKIRIEKIYPQNLETAERLNRMVFFYVSISTYFSNYNKNVGCNQGVCGAHEIELSPRNDYYIEVLDFESPEKPAIFVGTRRNVEVIAHKTTNVKINMFIPTTNIYWPQLP